MSGLDDSLCAGTPWGPWYNGMLSECFFQIVVMNVVFAFIWFGGIFRFVQLLRIPNSEEASNYTKLRIVEEVCCWSIVLLNVATFTGRIITDAWYWFQLMADVRDFAAWAICGVVVHLEYNKLEPHSWIIRTWWVLQFVSGAFLMQALSIRDAHPNLDDYGGSQLDIDVYIGRFVLTTILCISGLWCTPRARKHEYAQLIDDESSSTITSTPVKSYGTKRYEFEAETEKPQQPELAANIFSKLTFSWASKLMALGYERPLEQSDIWENKPENKVEFLHSLLNFKWQNQLRNRPNPSLPKAIFGAFLRPIILGGIYNTIFVVSQFVGPLILEQLLNFLEEEDKGENPELYIAFVLIAALFVGYMLSLFGGAWFFITTIQCGMNIRSAMVDLIYRKSLVINHDARQKSTVGEIVNLQAVDANRLLMFVPFMHIGWSSIITLIGSITLLAIRLKVAVLSGLAVMILCVPITSILFKRVGAIQKQMLELKDHRTRLINESLNGIRIIKFFGWETNFEAKIQAVREQEVACLRKIQYLKAVAVFLFITTPIWVTVATFATFSLQGNELTPAVAFTSLALFSVLRMPLAQIPMVIGTAVDFIVSVKRISNFLQLDEIRDDAVVKIDGRPSKGGIIVKISGGKFTWTAPPSVDAAAKPDKGKKGVPEANATSYSDTNPPPPPAILEDINIEVKRGQLVAIVGQVGSGKTTLLSAILGELRKVSGIVTVGGSVAYVSQQPWMQNATLRDNILFGKPYEETKYNECLRVCELLPDLEILPSGDKTEIGEKGINLSGGQKQRIALARALYQQADIYLLDSPLSAVDAHVGAAIFNNLITGALYDTTRLLVTHQLDILDRVDYIYVIKNGHIAEHGTYSKLLQNGEEFSELLKKYGKESTTSVFVTDQQDAQKEQKSITSAVVDQPKKAGAAPSAGSGVGGAGIMSVEEKQTGTIAWSVYQGYVKSVGGYFPVALAMSLFLLGSFSVLAGDLWLARWSTAFEGAAPVDTHYYLRIYTLIGATSGVIVLTRLFLLATLALKGSSSLHFQMLHKILHARMQFFDTTHVGRILNRFSKDMSAVDELIPMSVGMLLSTAGSLICIVGIVAGVTPFFLVIGLPIAYFYYFVQQYYLSSSRELSRIESVTKSPVYNQFSETLTGVSTIRAFGNQQTFIEENSRKIDENTKAFYAYMLAARWLSVRLEFVCALIVVAAALFIVVERENIGAGLAGATLSNAFQLTAILNFFVRQSVEVETQIVAVERIQEYSQVEEEGPYEVPANRPPPSWPSRGQIVFQDLRMRYRENLDLVLKGISALIESKEKVGIVGRTGSGKSSILLALYRMVEPASGTILIDDVDITKIGLNDLRSHLAIIPQDPTLFIGTIRSNLDPLGQYTDAELWRALDDAHLKVAIENSPLKLEAPVVENGENLSVGQRQLMCLARALLRNAKILLMDEATASVDMETDSLIQKTIREKFENLTVITIAHRINTIMDSHRVIVMDKGYVAEYDDPSFLAENKNSKFSALLNESTKSNNYDNKKDI